MDPSAQPSPTQALPNAEINVIYPPGQAVVQQGSSLQHDAAQLSNEFLEDQDENQFAETLAAASKLSPLLASFDQNPPSNSGGNNNPIRTMPQKAESRRQSQPTSPLQRKSVRKESDWARKSKGKLMTVSLLARRDALKMGEDNPHLLDIQLKIKEIARGIRQRVKKYSPQSQEHHIRPKNIDHSPQRLRDVVLSTIKPNKLAPSDDSKLLTFDEGRNQTIDSGKLVREVVRRDILQRVWARIDLQQKLRRNKLKLDPIKHKYPMSSFRRAVLQEDKQEALVEETRLREREQKLMQRRIIYNSSRYDKYIQRGKPNHALDSVGQSLVLHKSNDHHQHQSEFMENPEATAHDEPKETLFTTQIQAPYEEQPLNEAKVQPLEKKPHIHDVELDEEDYGDDFL